MKSLREAIASRVRQNHWRFHFPGHAGSPLGAQSVFSADIFQQDLTEVPELDVLGQPEGVLAELQDRYAKSYGVQASFALINGASTGLMASLLALPQKPDGPGQVLLARNVHRSVIQGLVLTGHQPVWILPESREDWGVWGAISAETVSKALKQNPDIQAVVLTHPTYEGLPSDIQAIATVCHAQNLPLIVDEAHGSLWTLLEDQRAHSAITAGADIVVHSLHKSAGALTQCAVIHVNHNSLLSPRRIQNAVNTLQTTSPSYLLLQSLEETLFHWTSPTGKQQLQTHYETCRDLNNWIKQHLESIEAMPIGHNGFQVLLRHRNMNAESFATELEETHGIAFESVNPKSVFLHLNPGLPKEAITALKAALLKLDSHTLGDIDYGAREDTFELNFLQPEVVLSPRQAFLSEGTVLPLPQALGEISRELVATCPPGIAILMPGERIHAHHIRIAQDSFKQIEIVTPFPPSSEKAVDKAPSFAYSSQYI